jgi:predicted MFS family arabinose efflux permease
MISRRSANRYLAMLTIICTFNSVDGAVLSLVLQDIKAEFSVTDAQMGVLTGIAFSIFYATLGIPLARWADRGNRVTILAVCTAFGGAAAALCATATSFIYLLLVRIAVAAGDAGFLPAANSLLADYFPREQRARACAIFFLHRPLSLFIGFFLAGWINELYGWRVAFAVLGIPGIVLAALAWPILKEPRRRAKGGPDSITPEALPETADSVPTLGQVASTLWSNRAFRHLLMCFALSSFFGVGIGVWQATFFVRSFGMSTGELGTWFALTSGIGGLIGIYLGGELATRYAAGNERLQLVAIAIAFCVFAFIKALVYVSPTLSVAFAFVAISQVGALAANGPLLGTIQTLIPDRMRAMSIALLFLAANLIGAGLGPVVAGALSDALRPTFGDESLRYALLALCPGYLWAAWHVWQASRRVALYLDVPGPDARLPAPLVPRDVSP